MPSVILIDLETTGLRPTRDRIIEIAAVRVVDDQITERFDSLIQPDLSLPSTITRLTGIDDVMLADAPGFDEIAPALHKWLGKDPLMAHNARFDYAFLRNAFKAAGLPYRTRTLCSRRLARQILPARRHHDLAGLAEHYTLTNSRGHRARDDVDTLWQLYNVWRCELGNQAFDDLLHREMRQTSTPANLPAGTIEAIPEGPGVYLFYGHNDLPLYVGKSIHLRSRVKGHFQRDHQEHKEMRLAQQVQRIDWIECSGDLGAQLKEAALIKQLTPIMNRRLRRYRHLLSWHWPDHLDTPQLSDERAHEDMDQNAFYGLYRHRRDAVAALREAARLHALCPRVLGLEKGKGRCFAQQLGKCRGACCGLEPLDTHARRARAALAGGQADPWPYSGRIAIGEHHPQTGNITYHVVERWVYLGAAKTLDEALSLSPQTGIFDLDAYRILQRFLTSPEDHNICVTALQARSAGSES